MGRILVLDDSPIVLRATRAALEVAGHQVTCVDAPAAFFTALESQQPDLALVDVLMPTLEGDAVVWIARARQLRGCLIILYSAKSEEELRPLVTSCGADGFICKSLDEGLLRRQVASLLTRTPPPPSGGAPG